MKESFQVGSLLGKVFWVWQVNGKLKMRYGRVGGEEVGKGDVGERGEAEEMVLGLWWTW